MPLSVVDGVKMHEQQKKTVKITVMEFCCRVLGRREDQTPKRKERRRSFLYFTWRGRKESTCTLAVGQL